MAHRAPVPKPGCLKLGVGSMVAFGLSVALCGAAGACEDIGPAQKPVPVRVSVPPAPRGPDGGRPVWPGDLCATPGATARTNTGTTLTCGRHRGLDHDTWR